MNNRYLRQMPLLIQRSKTLKSKATIDSREALKTRLFNDNVSNGG